MKLEPDEEVFVLLPDDFILAPRAPHPPRAQAAPATPARAATALARPVLMRGATAAARPLPAPAARPVARPAPRPAARPAARPAPPPTAPAAPTATPAPARALPAETAREETALPLTLGAVIAALLAGVLAWGWSYYELPLELRPSHPHHAALRSSGTVGLTLAIVGTGLMLLNLGYLLRKSVPWLQRAGSLRRWMNFHVLTGLIGPAMVCLHTGWLPTSILGTVSAGAMLIVVSTGILGRYIYSKVPRSLAGRELELDEVRRRLGEHHDQLAHFGIDARRIAGAAPPARGVLGALVSILVGDRGLRREFRRHRAAVLATPRVARHAAQVLPLLRQVVREGQWLARYHELRALMGSWRFLHRWLALLMLVFAACHIYVAFRYGDLWVLS